MRKSIHLAGTVCKYALLFITCQVFAFTSHAQASVSEFNNTTFPDYPEANHSKFEDISPLSIGALVPDITFHHILNYKTKTAKLSDFRGKLVILDMWSVTCTSCIGAFPDMEKLQKEFGDKIQILLVNPHDARYDSEGKILNVLNRLKERTDFYPTLPIPIHDSILNYYFPHKSVPHHIWIDADGKLIAITDHKNATVDNIRSILNGANIELPVKNDWAYDRKKPLLFDQVDLNAPAIVYRSLFTKYQEGIGFSSGKRLNKDGDVVGLFMLNKNLRYFINAAYNDLFKGVSNSRIFVESTNPELFEEVFRPKNAYCYDLILPAISPKKFDQTKYLKEDLKRYFNISVFKDKRKVKCWVIIKPLNRTVSFAKGKKEFDLEKNSIYKFIHNYTIEKVIKFLSPYFKLPLIDETGISDSCIDVDFPRNFDLTDDNAIVKVMRRLGFEVRQEVREIDVIVINDINE